MYTVNSDMESTRMGIKGSAKIYGDWSTGYTFEWENREALSSRLNQFNYNNAQEARPLLVGIGANLLGEKRIEQELAGGDFGDGNEPEVTGLGIVEMFVVVDGVLMTKLEGNCDDIAPRLIIANSLSISTELACRFLRNGWLKPPVT